MPIHDVGYRGWQGATTSTWSRWWVIAMAGMRGAFKSRWIRRMLLASWVPTIGLGVVFFMFENIIMSDKAIREWVVQSEDISRQQSVAQIRQRRPMGPPRQLLEFADEKTQASQAIRERFIKDAASGAWNADAVVAAVESGNPNELRNKVWCWLLMSFLRYPQGIMTLMIIGLLVPPLISRDVRSRAFLLYYSRPISRFEYIMGKLAVPAMTLMLITLVPALFLYFFGLLLSPDLSVIADTWDLPIRITAAAMVCVVPTCLVALLFSSMTQESRFAGFAWFTVWGLGAVVWSLIYHTNTTNMMIQQRLRPEEVHFESPWSLVSIYSTIGRVQSWIFGLETDVSNALPSIIVLGLITVVAFIWLYRRVSAPVRI